MEVKFADSFFESLKTVIRHQTWWYKTYKFIKKDIWRGLRNVWLFRKELLDYHEWDWRYQIAMFRRGLELEADYLEKRGLEITETRMKKVEKMRRVIWIMKLHEEGDFLGEAEKLLGYEYVAGGFRFEPLPDEKGYEMIDTNDEDTQAKNKALSDLANKIETETMVEFLYILKGQDYTEFDKEMSWEKQFDGGGIFGWWD